MSFWHLCPACFHATVSSAIRRRVRCRKCGDLMVRTDLKAPPLDRREAEQAVRHAQGLDR